MESNIQPPPWGDESAWPGGTGTEVAALLAGLHPRHTKVTRQVRLGFILLPAG
jgi:hypothetical protein